MPELGWNSMLSRIFHWTHLSLRREMRVAAFQEVMLLKRINLNKIWARTWCECNLYPLISRCPFKVCIRMDSFNDYGKSKPWWEMQGPSKTLRHVTRIDSLFEDLLEGVLSWRKRRRKTRRRRPRRPRRSRARASASPSWAPPGTGSARRSSSPSCRRCSAEKTMQTLLDIGGVRSRLNINTCIPPASTHTAFLTIVLLVEKSTRRLCYGSNKIER